jgi:hypothetical protein
VARISTQESPLDPTNPVLDTLNTQYGRIFTDHNVERVDHFTIAAASIGFVVHLVLIGLAHVLAEPPYFISLFDGSFLAAIYTPFSFILFYEVFALILSIPRSFTSSVGIQLQIISLIIIRRIFGDIGHLEDISTLELNQTWVQLLGLDMFAAIGMFFGVVAYSRLSQWVPDSGEFQDVETFVKLKRSITLLLAGLLIVLAAVTLISYLVTAASSLRAGNPIPLNENIVFYRDMFTVMVFADVAILLASLVYSHRFELVFRNAGFVISTILIRLSLSIPRPADLAFIGAAFFFSIMILVGYGLYLKVQARQTVEEHQEPDVV